jgi:hypothetical protein
MSLTPQDFYEKDILERAAVRAHLPRRHGLFMSPSLRVKERSAPGRDDAPASHDPVTECIGSAGGSATSHQPPEP